MTEVFVSEEDAKFSSTAIESKKDDGFAMNKLPEIEPPREISPKDQIINKLAEDSKNGDMHAKEELLKNMEPLISKIAKKYYGQVKSYEIEDLLNEARMNCVEAISTYKQSLVPFWSYAQMHIDGRMKNLLSYDNREKRTLPEGMKEINIDQLYNEGEMLEIPYHDPNFKAIEKESPENAMDMTRDGTYKDFVSKLDMSDLEAKTIILLRSGVSYKDIAKKLGYTDNLKKIDNARQRAVEKLQKYASLQGLKTTAEKLKKQ